MDAVLPFIVDYPPGTTFGAVVTGIDLREPSPSQLMALLDLWHERAVLVFPGQHLTDAEQIAFSAHFGRFERGLRQASDSKLAVLSNVGRDGEVVAPTELQARFLVGNTYWHADSSYKRVGAKASILSARVVPSEGGETEWADMRAAYDALAPDMKERLEGAVAVHSYAFSHTWHGGQEMLGASDLAHLGPVEHPVVVTHPATGRRNLYVGRHASHLVGEDVEVSRIMLALLTEEACQPPRLWTHRWERGDLAMWDNRCVLHRGHRWPDDQARTMVRTTLAGDDPTNEWVLPEES